MFLRRNSSGSSLSARAIMSIWLSYAHTSCGTPNPAERPRRRQVRVKRVRVDPDIIDVVGAGGGEARLLRHARADIGIGAAVPIHLAFTRGDASILVDAGFDAERAGMARDRVELLLHGERDLDRPPHEHG